MPVTVKKSFIIPLNGQTFVLSDEEMQKLQTDSKTETELTLVCDSPKCGSRFNLDGPTIRTWTLEDAQHNPDKVPEDANRFIPVNNGYVVCSKQCLKDWAEYVYVPAPSVKELREQMEAEKQKQAEQLGQLNPHLRASMQKIEHTPEGPKMVPDPETNAKLDELAESLVQIGTETLSRQAAKKILDAEPSVRAAMKSPELNEIVAAAGKRFYKDAAEEIFTDARRNVLSMPAVEVPALCQQEEDGYGHGV